MDVNMRSQNAFQASAQRKFYQWVLKWINAHGDEEVRDVQRSAKLDVPVLASFLQAIGFKLVSFEKHTDPLVPNNNEINNDVKEQKGTLQIAIECDASKMKAVLELGEITCQCPKPDHIKEASFWSISGTGPTANTDNIVRTVEETGSNLLPRLSKDVTRVLRDVSYRLFDTITCEPNMNRNIENNLNSSLSYLPNGLDTAKKDIGIIRSYTQPEICLHTPHNTVKILHNTQGTKMNSNSSINSAASPELSGKLTLKRQKTWDIETDTEPRPSSPKVTSSPVAELYASLGKISLEDENEKHANAVDYIIGAQQDLEKALEMLTVKKATLERRMTHDLSANQDNDGASVKSAPANVSPKAVIGPCKPTRSSTITKIKSVSKLSHLIAEEAKKISNKVTPVNRPKIDLTRSKSTTRLNVGLPQSSVQARRNSLYSPSPTNSIASVKSTGQKLSTRRSTSNLTIDTNLSSRLSTKKAPSPVQQGAYSPKLEATSNRSSSLKQPTKISKAIPVRTNSQSKVNTGSAKKAKDVVLSKEVNV